MSLAAADHDLLDQRVNDLRTLNGLAHPANSQPAANAGTALSLRFQEFRSDFPAFETCAYMNLAGRGILSRTTRRALDAGLDEQMMGRVNKAQWKDSAAQARKLFAALMGAQPHEIACTKNVSDGLNALSTALPWSPGDNVVYCPQFDHPNATYAWLNLSRMGVECRTVPLLSDGRIDVAAVLAATNARTRLVTLASVNFLSGLRAELAEIGHHCRRENIFFLVDGAQSTGVLEVDVVQSCIDGWCASANKGLLGTYGVGFAYCREEWARQLQPVYLSRFGVDAEHLPESEMSASPHTLFAGARRFEVGNANWTGITAVAASMQQLAQFAPYLVEQRAMGLASRLAHGLREAGFEVPRLDRRELQSHIVSVFGDARDNTRLERLDEMLGTAGVAFSKRLGAIRFGLHAYNSESDVDLVVDIASRLR